MEQNLYIEGISEEVKEEILFLYKLGIKIEEIEYLINVKVKENLFILS